MASDQHRSIAAVLGIVCAVGSFFVYHSFWGIVLAILAILFGLFGFLRSASPRVSGGILSIAAVGIGVIALLFSLLKGVFHVLT